ncbi:MAG TPA: phosphonate ABC transporter, permease protein PhnE [Opitutaceae bacterium]
MNNLAEPPARARHSSAAALPSAAAHEPPATPLYRKLLQLLAAAAFTAVLAWAWNGAEIRFGELIADRGNMIEYGRAFLQPDFTDYRLFFTEMVVTLQIALCGTVLALLAAAPCSLLASSNLAPWWLRSPVRRVMDALRSINEMVFAMIFISAVGLGPFAGVLAVFLHNLGVLTKLFSEAVEAIEPGPVEGVRAVGASPLEEIAFGVIPQVMPHWISAALYRFESNVRSATVVGIVGAGGIGMLLWDAIRSFDYARTSAILLVVIAVVILLDLSSARLRRAFI